jgi:hypothetical protein
MMSYRYEGFASNLQSLLHMTEKLLQCLLARLLARPINQIMHIMQLTYLLKISFEYQF